MHILISHAGVSGPRCTQALASLELPALATISRSWVARAVAADSASLTPLHERLHASLLGLPAPDGLVPWAARQALEQNIAGARATGWAWLTLCHWTINADHVEMSDPAALEVTPQESATLMEAMRDFFAEDGITLHNTGTGTWLASGEVFRDLPTASLQRTSGAQVDAWMPRQPQAKPLRRLQNEMQMLLYTHPINDARAQRRLPAINSFWVSGTGSLPQGLPAEAADVQVVEVLRTPSQQDDAKAWAAAWQHIDSTVLAPLLQAPAPHGLHQVTLCGESSATTYTLEPQSWWARLQNRLRKPDLSALLTTL